jgi:hypothetical protein
VFYLENTTDLEILRVFAELLKHPAREHLELPFLHPVGTNLPQKARDHFFGLREAKDDLVGIAIFDRLDKALKEGTPLTEMMWRRREIENYFCTQDILLRFAESDAEEDLFGLAERQKRMAAMKASISEVAQALATLGKPDPWSVDIKASDEFLDPLFKKYSEKLDAPLVLRKNEYFKLARFMAKKDLDPEIKEKLDAVLNVARFAHPAG